MRTFREWLQTEALHPKGAVYGLEKDIERFNKLRGFGHENGGGGRGGVFITDMDYIDENLIEVSFSADLEAEVMPTLSKIFQKWGFKVERREKYRNDIELKLSHSGDPYEEPCKGPRCRSNWYIAKKRGLPQPERYYNVGGDGTYPYDRTHAEPPTNKP